MSFVRRIASRLTPTRVGVGLTLVTGAGLVVALATEPTDLGPTAAVLTPFIYVSLAVYVIAAIWTCVGVLKRSKGSTRNRAFTTFAVAVGLCLLVPLGAVFFQPVVWIAAAVLNWPRKQIVAP
jgi:hypothetical protein